MSTLFRCNACKATYSDTQRDGSLNFHACAPLPPDKHGVQRERPDKRDENILIDRRGRILGIISAGAGAYRVADGSHVEPKAVADVMKRVEKEDKADVRIF